MASGKSGILWSVVLLMLLMGFVEFSDPLKALLPAVCYLALHTIEGQVVTPIVLGRRMAISPLILILSLLVFIGDALREAGLSCPDDVALVGFDNWNVMAEAARPPLTSVDMNLVQLGAEAGRQMIEMINGVRVIGTRRLPCTLVVRQSS